MKIVHTESSLGWGGQEIRILSESQGLARRGHEVRLLCPAEARIFVEAPNWGLQPEAVPIARKSWNGFVSLKKKFQGCDVISTHSSTDSWLCFFTDASEQDQIFVPSSKHAATGRGWRNSTI